MAKTSSFKFTNTTASEHTVTPVELAVVDNYAVERDTANTATLNNKTAPIDAQEIVSYQSYTIPEIRNNLNLQNPPKVPGGILYSVQLQDTLVTEDASVDFRLDEPIVAVLQIRHPRSGNIDNTVIGEVVTRLISACRRADGSWRFDDLMRSAERPIAN
jgi:hypothetical protein